MLKFNKTGVPPTAEEISELEAKIGHKLPSKLVQVYSDPTIEFTYPNKFPTQDNESYFGDLSSIFSFTELADEYKFFSSRYGFNHLLPIATDTGSNFILVDLNETGNTYGHIYYFEFDLRDLHKTSEDIRSFIDSVSCYSLSEIPLEDMQGATATVASDLKNMIAKSK